MSEPTRRRRRFRYSLRGLLVTVVVVAAFLNGRRSLEWLPDASLWSGLYTIRLGVGETTTLTSKAGVPQVIVFEPNVCGVEPKSTTEIIVRGLAPGTTKVSFWLEKRPEPVSYEVVVRAVD